MRTNFICALLLSVSGALAQSNVGNYTSSLNMTVDPGTVSVATRASWCTAQTNTCSLLCDDNTNKNGCMVSNLDYDCVCASNNSAPGLQYYTQTMPTFICFQLYSDCISNNVGNKLGQDACTSHIKNLCGTVPPPSSPVDSGSGSTTTSGNPSTMTTSVTGASGTQVAETSSSKAFAAPTKVPLSNGVAAMAAMGALAYFL